MSLPVFLSVALVVQSVSPESPRPADASATETPADQAQRFYDQGVELFRTAQFEAAALSFEQAYALVPEASLLYNISLAWEQAGELERALEALERYAADSPPAEAEQVAPQIEGLRQRIAKLQRGEDDDVAEDDSATASSGTACPCNDRCDDASRRGCDRSAACRHRAAYVRAGYRVQSSDSGFARDRGHDHDDPGSDPRRCRAGGPSRNPNRCRDRRGFPSDCRRCSRRMQAPAAPRRQPFRPGRVRVR